MLLITILELIYLIIKINAIDVQWFEKNLLFLMFFHSTNWELNDNIAGKKHSMFKTRNNFLKYSVKFSEHNKCEWITLVAYWI